MRKQIDGIALQVQEVLELNPLLPTLFAFCNRQRDKVKILFWHDNGFCLLYKRLEKGRFQWPTTQNETLCCSTRELKWLLEGLALDDLQDQKKVMFKAV